MLVSFLEPGCFAVQRDMNEPLPSVIDLAVSQAFQPDLPPADFPTKSTIRVRRFRLEEVDGAPRYVWQGLYER